jgi:hypothetical protein
MRLHISSADFDISRYIGILVPRYRGILVFIKNILEPCLAEIAVSVKRHPGT